MMYAKIAVPLAGAALAVAIGLAPAAHAFSDRESAFLRHVSASGVTSVNGEQAIVNVGWMICDALAANASRISLIRQLMGYSEAGYQLGRPSVPLTNYQASDVVLYADEDLCPEVWENQTRGIFIPDGAP